MPSSKLLGVEPFAKHLHTDSEFPPPLSTFSPPNQ